MTCKEKAAIERPDDVNIKYIGGVRGCPNEYGYMDAPLYCCSPYGENIPDTMTRQEACTRCWNREIPGTESATPHILDSGNRRQFETGAVRDIQEGKGRMDLLPWTAIMEVSKHCEAGANKYGEHNVDKGIPTHSLCDSAARHLAKYLEGWEDEPHLVAAAWNLLWAIQMELTHPECVDTPWTLLYHPGENKDA